MHVLSSMVTRGEEPKRIIVIGDAHGDIERVIHVLKAANILIDGASPGTFHWIAEPGTVVVQMGDQLDSNNRVEGLEEWELVPDIALLEFMDNLDAIAQPLGGRVYSLIGNHELMNMLGDFSYVSKNSTAIFGGSSERRRYFMPGMKGCEAMCNRYVVLKIGSFLFCHAGIIPAHLNIIGENVNILNEVFWNYVKTRQVHHTQVNIFKECIIGLDGVLWTRKYMSMILGQQEDALKHTLSIVLRTTKCSTMFLGHNTVMSTTVLANGALVLTDAGFSRAYGKSKYQYIDIKNNTMQVMEI